MEDEKLKYPIGRFCAPESYSEENISSWIEAIGTFPQRLREAIINLTHSQLEIQYRPGGWTLKQVVHHLADSHMNALTRFKLALTEDNPTIKPYEEAAWAQLTDYQLPLESSLKILEGVHLHMATLLKMMEASQWDRTFHHPEINLDVPLKRNLAMYVWHGNHHLAQITETIRNF